MPLWLWFAVNMVGSSFEVKCCGCGVRVDASNIVVTRSMLIIPNLLVRLVVVAKKVQTNMTVFVTVALYIVAA